MATLRKKKKDTYVKTNDNKPDYSMYDNELGTVLSLKILENPTALHVKVEADKSGDIVDVRENNITTEGLPQWLWHKTKVMVRNIRHVTNSGDLEYHAAEARIINFNSIKGTWRLAMIDTTSKPRGENNYSIMEKRTKDVSRISEPWEIKWQSYQNYYEKSKQQKAVAGSPSDGSPGGGGKGSPSDRFDNRKQLNMSTQR